MPRPSIFIYTVVLLGTQRRFVWHEDDRRFVGPECMRWAGSHYVSFNCPKLALIDVTTMKMCFPATADGMKLPSHSCTFSSDFRWLLYQEASGDRQGLYLAPVETP